MPDSHLHDAGEGVLVRIGWRRKRPILVRPDVDRAAFLSGCRMISHELGIPLRQVIRKALEQQRSGR